MNQEEHDKEYRNEVCWVVKSCLLMVLVISLSVLIAITPNISDIPVWAQIAMGVTFLLLAVSTVQEIIESWWR